jgi:nicotinamide-nucleotide amidase
MKTITPAFLDELVRVLTKKELLIASAESCTGGLIGHTLTNISGSSTYFDRGVISYSNQAKMDLLAVPKLLLDQYGAVSAEVAEAMAEGIQKKSGVDIGIATTGIAGPTGGSKEKPVGLVYIALATKSETIVQKFQFSGNRLENKEETCAEALHMLYDFIN